MLFYLMVIFIDLLDALYVLSPAKLNLAVYLPFLTSFILNLATPFAFVFAVYFLPLILRVIFFPALRYVLPLYWFLTVFRVTLIDFVLAFALKTLAFAVMLVFLAFKISLVLVNEALYWLSPKNDRAYVYVFAAARFTGIPNFPSLSVVAV